MAEQDANADATPEDKATDKPAETPVTKSNHLLESDGVDPDLKELEEAEAAVKAEEAAAAGGEEEKPEPETPQGEEGEKPEGEKPPAQVPVAVVQEERHKRQSAEQTARKAVETALYWKNVAEGKLPQPGARVQEPEPMPQSSVKERRSEIRSQIATLAEQVDNGTMSMKDFETQKSALEDELDDLRESALRAELPKGGDLYLDTLTRKLESDNPWLADVPDDELEVFQTLARKDLIKSGYDLKGKAGTPEADYQLRCALVDRLKQHGYATDAAATAPPANPKKPNVNAKPTKEQFEEKQQLANDAPPAPRGVSAPADGWTPERVAEMDSVDLENLPMKDLERILGVVNLQETTRRVNSASRK